MHEIPFVLRGAPPEKAICIGNNAAWLCPCGERKQPLIGRTGSVKGPSAKTRVKCDKCTSAFYVVPDGCTGAKAREVIELPE